MGMVTAKHILLSKIYIYGPGKPIKKFECVGHYQKRVGSRLRNSKKKTQKD